MQRAIAVLALVLVHSAPCWCRKLPDQFADFDRAHHETVDEDPRSAGEDGGNEESESIETSVERFGLLPTPNVASPAVGTIVVPAKGHVDNIHTNINPYILSTVRKTPKSFFAIETQNSAPGSPVNRHSASVTVVSRDSSKTQTPNKHHKTKPVDDGGIWSKFPSKTHLVEIVPIKHKSNTKTKALAYIVPKSHSVKKKLKKQKRVSGILIDRHMPIVSEKLDIGFGNSKSYSFEHISSDITSVEPKSSENEDDTTENKDAGFKEDTDRAAYNDESVSEQTINEKINDIVSYFKENKDDSLDSLIHDVLPDGKVDPEYHVHYIIHKKRNPHHNHHSNEDSSQDNGHHVVNINYELDDEDSKHNEINIYPQHEHHNNINEHEHEHHNNINEQEHEHHPHHHHHVTHISSNSNEDHFHSSHNLNEHVESLPNNHEHHAIHDITPTTQDDHTPVQHNQSFEDINNTSIKDDEIISIQSLEQLHDKFHEESSGHDLNEFNENGNLHHEINVSEDPLLHEVHEQNSQSDESNSSDDSDEDPSSENYSDSSGDDTASGDLDTNQSISDVSDLKPTGSSDSNGSSVQSNSASDSEDRSISSDENYSESNVNEYVDPFVITEDGYILGNDYEDPIINIHEHNFQDPPIANIDQFIHGHGLIDATPQESSSENLEPDSSPEASELTINDLTHSLMFPNCRTLKKKLVKKGDKHHKSYTLTFLFNK